MREVEQSNMNLLKSKVEKIINIINECNIDNESLHEFDASAIYLELSRKEALENLTNDKTLFEFYFSISTEINNLAGDINSGEDYELIKQKLNNFQIKIDSINDEPGLKKYVQQWLYSVKALLMYRMGEYNDSFSLTYLAIDLIDELIDKYNIDSFIFRLILQYSNLSNIFFKTRELYKATDLRKEIMDYLFRGQCNLLPKSFRNVELWNEMEFIREYNAIYYFKTTVDKINYLKSKDLNLYYLFFNRTIKPFIDIELLNLERYYLVNWINIEVEFVEKNNIAFISAVEEFFDEDISVFFNFLVIYILESIELMSNISISETIKTKYKNINEDLFHKKQL